VPTHFGTLLAPIFCSGADYKLLLVLFGAVCINIYAGAAPSNGAI
jgi:hypothetical protein